MICKRCGKNNAEIYYKQTINGQTEEYALCSDCMEELKKEGKLNIKLPSIFDDFGFGMGGLYGIGDLLGFPYDSRKKAISDKKRCTLCASTFEDFVKNGKIGCAKCYEVFADELKRSIESIHGNAKYLGRRPGKFKEVESKQSKLKNLKSELKAAIKSQEFEKAAELRDEIRSMESEM